MRITEKLKLSKQLISFEVFPPKTDIAFESIEKSVRELAAFSPDFMSVTYGAGGGTSEYTVKIASMIKNKLNTTSIAHLTCASTTKEKISEMLCRFKENNIENVLALRGDIPENFNERVGDYYEYASELVKVIKSHDCFDIGAACYPEGHPESSSPEEDLEHLKYKTDCGVDFLTTQMFFDNGLFYDFLDRACQKQINVPIFAGIMPITGINQVDRIIRLSGAKIPNELETILKKYENDPDSLQKATVDYGINQINDLLKNGVRGVHIYTMNKPFVAKAVLKGISR
ncbi:MAG: methylenetetrahydrofolate reductase [NAD(P)H] [Oscillospiraceae bacterium]|nr:methylenetetrahydrofolate reductase [NAD(P)H] [Oscillospiraceae bacterium]